MIPNLYWAVIALGPLTLQVWGIFVALGIGTALYVAKRYALARGLHGQKVIDAGFWIILGSLLGARIFFVVTEWQLFADNLGSIIYLWEGGMSISGGFIGAAITGWIYFKKHHLPFWAYADAIIFALPLGIAIGRLGCFFIFDHPGSVTDFVLGEVYYGDGLVRHNHGLYLSINGLVIFLVFLWLQRRIKQPQAPFFITIFLIWDGLFRLLMDDDRILDSTLGPLTAAQWVGIVMIVGGLVIFGQRQNIRKHFQEHTIAAEKIQKIDK